MTREYKREYIIRQIGDNMKFLEIAPRGNISLFNGNINDFDFKKTMKRVKSAVPIDYMLRCSLAAFCYGVYVRLLF